MGRRNRALLALTVASGVGAINVAPPEVLSTPQIDYGLLGPLGVVGSFSDIAAATYKGRSSIMGPPARSDDLLIQSGSTLIAEPFANGAIYDYCFLNDSTVVFLGNFTEVDKISANVAALDLHSGQITALGQFNGGRCLFCNNSSVYVGGDIQFNNSFGVAVYETTSSTWKLPPFGGFTEGSRVNSIVLNGDNLVFGGSLTGLKKQISNGAMSRPSDQLVSFELAQATSPDSAFDSNPADVLCLSTNSWNATNYKKNARLDVDVGYIVSPKTLKLFNLDGKNGGVKSWRVSTQPTNGIMNMSFIDESGNVQFCSENCPLSPGVNVFSFVNIVDTRKLQFQFIDYYGDHSGLHGLQLFEDNLVVSANNILNQLRSCQQNFRTSRSELSGIWSTHVDFQESIITSPLQLPEVWARFYPNLTGTGNFLIKLYTPGCSQYKQCDERGGMNVTVYPGHDMDPVTTILYQTNMDMKYDFVFNGTLYAEDGFQPYLQIQPLIEGRPEPWTFVAYKAEFVYLGSSEILPVGNLFEFSPQNFSLHVDDEFSGLIENTIVNTLGARLHSEVYSLLVKDGLWVGGNFSNILHVHNQDVDSVSINSTVYKLFDNGDVLSLTSSGLYAINNETRLLAGPVDSVVPFVYNDTQYMALSSDDSFGLLDPKTYEWHNDSRIRGHLSHSFNYGNIRYYFGGLHVGQAYPSAVQINGSEQSYWNLNLTGNVTDGVILQNKTFLSGAFNVTYNDGFTSNLIFLEDGEPRSLSISFEENSFPSALAPMNTSLIVGGNFVGLAQGQPVKNLFIYDTLADSIIPVSGVQDVRQITSIRANPNAKEFVVTGDFDVEGCTGACLYNPGTKRWSRLGIDSGLVTQAEYLSDKEILLSGAWTSDSRQIYLGTYNLAKGELETDTQPAGPVLSFVVGESPQSGDLVIALSNNGLSAFSNGTWRNIDEAFSVKDATSLAFLPSLEGSTKSPLPKKTLLVVTGQLQLDDYGDVSAVTWDGETWKPYLVSRNGEAPGVAAFIYAKQSLSNILPLEATSQEPIQPSLTPSTTVSPTEVVTSFPAFPIATHQPEKLPQRKYMSRGHVVGVSCAIAIGCISLLVSLYLIAALIVRRKYEEPLRLTYKDVMDAVPPEELIQNIRR